MYYIIKASLSAIRSLANQPRTPHREKEMDEHEILWVVGVVLGVLATAAAGASDPIFKSRAQTYCWILCGGFISAFAGYQLLMLIVNSCLLGIEIFLLVSKGVREREAFNAKLRECLESVCLQERGSVVNVSADTSEDQPNRHSPFRSYKFRNWDYHSLIQLDDFDNLNDRVQAKTNVTLIDAGLDTSYSQLGALASLGGPGTIIFPELLPNLVDRYHCKITKEEYDAFDGTPKPVLFDLYPFRSTNIVDSVQEIKVE